MRLLARAARVVAIEIDRKLVELLREKYANEPRLTIVEGDVLDGESRRARRRPVRARRKRALLHHDADSLSGAQPAARAAIGAARAAGSRRAHGGGARRRRLRRAVGERAGGRRRRDAVSRSRRAHSIRRRASTAPSCASRRARSRWCRPGWRNDSALSCRRRSRSGESRCGAWCARSRIAAPRMRRLRSRRAGSIRMRAPRRLSAEQFHALGRALELWS